MAAAVGRDSMLALELFRVKAPPVYSAPTELLGSDGSIGDCGGGIELKLLRGWKA